MNDKSDIAGERLVLDKSEGADSVRGGMHGREGIAIVLVLGLIAVLMVSAVAFAISMRIERQGSFQYRYGIQARHMLWVGVSEAIKEIDGIMGDSLYPEWDMRCSTNSGAGTANVLVHSITNFFSGQQCTNMILTTPYWHTIKDSSGIQVGRYAFVVINQSGLMDANKAGGFTRGGGTNTAEIQLSNLPEINDATMFVTDRTNRHFRYESIAELAKIASGRGLKPSVWPVNLGAYSLSPDREVVRNGVVTTKQKAYIGGTKAELQAKEAEIKQGFTDCGVSDVNQAFISLLDYVDSDNIPEKLDAGCGEAVPMINEVALYYRVNLNTNTGAFTGNYELHVETAYPFEAAGNEGFKVKVTWTCAAEADNTFPALVPSSTPGIDTAVTSDPLTYCERISAKTPIAGNVGACGGATKIHFKAKVKAEVMTSGGQVVDSVPYPLTGSEITLEIKLSLTPLPKWTTLPDKTAVEAKDWAECVDSRFNWNPVLAGRQWFYGSSLLVMMGLQPTLNDVNAIALYMFANPGEIESDFDGDMYLHVANAPMKTIGELGNLCIRPWMSIRLYDHNIDPLNTTDPAFHPVFDYFTASTNSYRRGLVNINTTNANVLASLFFNVPTTEYGDPTTPFTDWNTCLNVATRIINNGPYTNLSDIGRSTVSSAWTNLTGCSTEVGKEGPLRNTADFLTVRDNQFAIVVAADAFSAESFGGMGRALASARALAEVWRDPFKDSNGRHRVMIRQFRMLGD